MTSITQLTPLTGDLILFPPKSCKSTLNTWGQTLVTQNAASFSHIAITTCPGSYIHAEKKSLVHQSGLHDVVLDRNRPVKVYRRLDVDQDRKLEQRLYKSLVKYLDQPYSIVKPVTGSDGSTYCSKLAFRAFKDVGIPISTRESLELPVDIQQAVQGADWVDVTDIYESYFSSEDLSRLAEEQGNFQRTQAKQIYQNAKRQEEVLEALKKISPSLQSYELQQSQPYWNDKKKEG